MPFCFNKTIDACSLWKISRPRLEVKLFAKVLLHFSRWLASLSWAKDQKKMTMSSNLHRTKQFVVGKNFAASCWRHSPGHVFKRLDNKVDIVWHPSTNIKLLLSANKEGHSRQTIQTKATVQEEISQTPLQMKTSASPVQFDRFK